MSVDTILTVLSAYSRAEVREAVKAYAVRKFDGRKKEGWKFLPPGEDVPEGYDWTELNGKRYIRESGWGAVTSEEQHPRQDFRQKSSEKRHRMKSNVLATCPVCKRRAYPQPICRSCDKGKAGLRYQWICGDNSDHVFYTE